MVHGRFSVTFVLTWKGAVYIHGTHGNSHTAIVDSNKYASKVVGRGRVGSKTSENSKIQKTSNF